MGIKKKNLARLRLVTIDGIRVYESTTSPRGPRRRKRLFVQKTKLLNGELFPLLLGCRSDRDPVMRGDSSALTPFLGTPVRDVQVIGHFNQGVPEIKDIVNGLDRGFGGHAPNNGPDSESGQARTCRQVTEIPVKRTICPDMGKATTPLSFKIKFCERVKAARTMKDLTQAQVAARLGIKEDTYGKYERRSLPPHFLIPKLGDVLGVPTDFFYTGHKEQSRAA